MNDEKEFDARFHAALNKADFDEVNLLLSSVSEGNEKARLTDEIYRKKIMIGNARFYNKMLEEAKTIIRDVPDSIKGKKELLKKITEEENNRKEDQRKRCYDGYLNDATDLITDNRLDDAQTILSKVPDGFGTKDALIKMIISAKARAEAEAKARAEAEAKLKAEAEARARAEAEAKAKSEAEEKARIEAEARSKVEAEIKERLEKEAKIKAKAEARVRAEAEGKARIEAEARTKKEIVISDDTLVPSIDNNDQTPSDRAVKSEEKQKKSKPVAIIIALLVIVLVIGAVLLMVLTSKDNETSSDDNNIIETEEESNDNQVVTNSNGVVKPTNGRVDVKDGVELKWDQGEAKLKQYEIVDFGEGEGLELVLYIDFSNPDKENQTMNNNLSVTVFQDKVGIDEGYTDDTNEASDGYKEVQQGASLMCAREFIMPESDSPITVRFTAWSKDYENEYNDEMQIVLPETSGEEKGNSSWMEHGEDEVEIKDGTKLAFSGGEATITGYKIWHDDEYDEDVATFYLDFKNNDKEVHSFDNYIYLKVFQNGTEIDGRGLIDTTIESRAGNYLQKGGSIHCAKSYTLKGSKGDLDVELYTYDDDFNEIKVEQEIKLN